MPITPPLPASPVAGGPPPAPERDRAERAEAALAQAQARIAALEDQLAASAGTAQRHYAQLNALVQALQVGLVLVDPEGQIQFVNQFFWELFGLAPVANPAAGAPPLVPADVQINQVFADPAAFKMRVRDLNAAGGTALREVFALADGRVVELDYLVLDQGRGGRLICYRDVTERHQRDAQLAGQRAFYEHVLEQIPTAVAVFDDAHRYLYVNPALEPDPARRAQMLGQTSAAACPSRWRTPGTEAHRAAAFAEAVRTQRPVAWNETHTGDTEPRHFQIRYQPAPGPAGAQWVISTGTDITERKRAEERLANQQEFYESVLNLLPVDVAVFDPDHRFLFVNPSGLTDPAERERAIGLTNVEFLAKRPQAPPGLAAQRERCFAEAVATRQDVSWEEVRPTPQGPQLILRSFRPIFTADGNLRWMVGTGLDLTARYAAEERQLQAQARLQQQQDFMRQVVDALPDALYMMGPDGRPAFANGTFRTSMERSAHAQPGAEKNTVVQDELRQIGAFNDLVLRTQQAQTRELPFTLATGETRYYSVYKQPMQQPDGAPGVLTVSSDVTAMKQARQALERREKQYHDLVYYSQALICTHDAEGRLLSVNPAIEQLMGLSAAALVGHYLHEAMPPEYHAALEEYLKNPAPLAVGPQSVLILTATGEKRYLNYYSHRVAEPGQPPYVVASGYDVTAGVRAQRALQQAKQEAEENASAKEAFLAHMSHEIRTPLNGVLGMAALLQKTPLTDSQAEYLHTMQHAGRHLLALLNDVLDMAKITAQQLELDHAPFDLAVALQGASQTVASLAEAKGLQLTVTLWPSSLSPRVLGDAYRLHQVLLNLLSNAIKFTERGRVRLGADVLRDAPGALTVRFWVEDTGIGIPPAQQAHIFEAFAQAGTETSPRFGGTGLGLAISQQLVAQMGGVLRLTSTPGHGTTFAFQLTLPRPTPAAAPAAPAPPPAYDELQGRRILLAEDNPVNQFIAVVVLERWGVQVQAVANGTDALDYLRTQPFDAALLDIRMPGLSGVAVTAAIRQHADPVRATVPIIALTANAFDTDRAGYLAAGMDACLTKPYEEAALYQLLVQLLARAEE
ncbi:PAS domain-containing protein [Hymenobacter nivis]|uniref:histidine kinase n=1 Tax=Hymenobacter nivis TaxID=1850093 RepID=A0A502GZZ0_9BACT|nr:PAS domain-containing protein [Hymenobacter nivis]TPG66613.1 PAS domain S-box protein [Hymenobacter nivis]